MAANKIGILLMVSDFNENWYLGVFWSEELVGNDKSYVQGHFYEATVFKMAANKIIKLSMVSDFNENWYLGLFLSEKLIGNDENCIQGHFLRCHSFQNDCQHNRPIVNGLRY
jgi:hypothetical protein